MSRPSKIRELLACRWSPIFTTTGKMNLGICKHVLGYYRQRTTLTIKTTKLFLFCDKFCQKLYKSVPFLMSFASFKVNFIDFYFNLTFEEFNILCPFIKRGWRVATGDFYASRLSFRTYVRNPLLIILVILNKVKNLPFLFSLFKGRYGFSREGFCHSERSEESFTNPPVLRTSLFIKGE